MSRTCTNVYSPRCILWIEMPMTSQSTTHPLKVPFEQWLIGPYISPWFCGVCWWSWLTDWEILWQSEYCSWAVGWSNEKASALMHGETKPASHIAYIASMSLAISSIRVFLQIFPNAFWLIAKSPSLIISESRAMRWRHRLGQPEWCGAWKKKTALTASTGGHLL